MSTIVVSTNFNKFNSFAAAGDYSRHPGLTPQATTGRANKK